MGGCLSGPPQSAYDAETPPNSSGGRHGRSGSWSGKGKDGKGKKGKKGKHDRKHSKSGNGHHTNGSPNGGPSSQPSTPSHHHRNSLEGLNQNGSSSSHHSWKDGAAAVTASSASELQFEELELDDWQRGMLDIMEEQSIQAYDMDMSLAPGERRYSNSFLGFPSQLGLGGGLGFESPVPRSRAGTHRPYAGSIVDLSPPPSNPTVLVVDEHPSTRQIITKWMSSSKYTEISCATGTQAQEILLPPSSSSNPALQIHHVDVIICDVNVYVSDGQLLLDWVLNTPSISNIPVIVLSSNLPSQGLERLIRRGAWDVLHKPLNRAVFLNALGTVFVSRKQKIFIDKLKAKGDEYKERFFDRQQEKAQAASVNNGYATIGRSSTAFPFGTMRGSIVTPHIHSPATHALGSGNSHQTLTPSMFTQPSSTLTTTTTSPSAGTVAQSIQVLLVENDPSTSSQLRSWIESDSVSVRVVSSVQEAVGILRESQRVAVMAASAANASLSFGTSNPNRDAHHSLQRSISIDTRRSVTAANSPYIAGMNSAGSSGNLQHTQSNPSGTLPIPLHRSSTSTPGTPQRGFIGSVPRINTERVERGDGSSSAIPIPIQTQGIQHQSNASHSSSSLLAPSSASVSSFRSMSVISPTHHQSQISQGGNTGMGAGLGSGGSHHVSSPSIPNLTQIVHQLPALNFGIELIVIGHDVLIPPEYLEQDDGFMIQNGGGSDNENGVPGGAGAGSVDGAEGEDEVDDTLVIQPTAAAPVPTSPIIQVSPKIRNPNSPTLHSPQPLTLAPSALKLPHAHAGASTASITPFPASAPVTTHPTPALDTSLEPTENLRPSHSPSPSPRGANGGLGNGTARAPYMSALSASQMLVDLSLQSVFGKQRKLPVVVVCNEDGPSPVAMAILKHVALTILNQPLSQGLVNKKMGLILGLIEQNRQSLILARRAKIYKGLLTNLTGGYDIDNEAPTPGWNTGGDSVTTPSSPGGHGYRSTRLSMERANRTAGGSAHASPRLMGFGSARSDGGRGLTSSATFSNMDSSSPPIGAGYMHEPNSSSATQSPVVGSFGSKRTMHLQQQQLQQQQHEHVHASHISTSSSSVNSATAAALSAAASSSAIAPRNRPISTVNEDTPTPTPGANGAAHGGGVSNSPSVSSVVPPGPPDMESNVNGLSHSPITASTPTPGPPPEHERSNSLSNKPLIPSSRARGDSLGGDSPLLVPFGSGSPAGPGSGSKRTALRIKTSTASVNDTNTSSATSSPPV